MESLELKASFFKLNKSFSDILYENSQVLLNKQLLKSNESQPANSLQETSFSEDFFKAAKESSETGTKVII